MWIPVTAFRYCKDMPRQGLLGSLWSPGINGKQTSVLATFIFVSKRKVQRRKLSTMQIPSGIPWVFMLQPDLVAAENVWSNHCHFAALLQRTNCLVVVAISLSTKNIQVISYLSSHCQVPSFNGQIAHKGWDVGFHFSTLNIFLQVCNSECKFQSQFTSFSEVHHLFSPSSS